MICDGLGWTDPGQGLEPVLQRCEGDQTIKQRGTIASLQYTDLPVYLRQRLFSWLWSLVDRRDSFNQRSRQNVLLTHHLWWQQIRLQWLLSDSVLPSYLGGRKTFFEPKKCKHLIAVEDILSRDLQMMIWVCQNLEFFDRKIHTASKRGLVEAARAGALTHFDVRTTLP